MARNVLVTGSDGLIGWHTRCRMHTLEELKVQCCNRDEFLDDAYLANAIANADAIIHLAGVNRGDTQTLESDNIKITTRLVSMLESLQVKPHVLFSNSIHMLNDTPYGRSKRECAKVLRSWADQHAATFTDVVLPHVFGEHGRPYYNSVVSTFSDHLVRRTEPLVRSNTELKLLHTSDVAKLLIDHVKLRTNGVVEPDGVSISVRQLLELMKRLWDAYDCEAIPNFQSTFETQLFNTIRSAIPTEFRTVRLKMHEDNRGRLFEALRSHGAGQVFFSTTQPGITRGNHFHTRKIERFVVVEGEAEVRLRRLLTGEVVTYRLSGSQPHAIDIPTLHVHNLTNIGESALLTLFWCNEHYNSSDPDTFYELV